MPQLSMVFGGLLVALGLVGYVVYLRMRAELPPVEAEAEQEGYGNIHDESGGKSQV